MAENDTVVVRQDLSLHERVIALMQRERTTRFAGGQLGALWAYLTPIFWIALVAGAFHLIGRAVPILTHPALFVATGILPYALLRQAITSMNRSVIANRFLPMLPGIRLFDVLLATALLELFNSVVTAVLIFGAISVAFGVPMPDDPAQVLAALGVAWMLGVSLGNLFAAIGRVSDTFARSVPLLLRPLFWLSAIFYITAEVPAVMVYWLGFNPLVHVIEVLREGYFFGYRAVLNDIGYPVVFALSCLLLSYWVNRWVDNNKLSRHRA
ncbi:ABC transporter permease [Ferrimonas balearica]|uniref:ABC transporter permease n=1 Tax=Ferrimonas balearica TaxID=44012 RepID=UPI001C96B51F|nr:ABC transporter permease [Ferrimonas balearica]MBY5981234.1 ABC transporter permease [Ferrimonas balearica]